MACTRRRRFPIAVAAATGVALLVGGPAFAHIDPEPPEVQAGTEATVGFTVEHGCGESPTTMVEIQLPEGSAGIAGVDGDGFTSTVDGRVVAFEGGPLDANTEQTFSVTFTVPDTPGEVPVKLIQTCEEGSIDWIELEEDGQPEPEHPAPLLTITPGDATATTTITEATAGSETTAAPEATSGSETTEAAPVTTNAPAGDEDDSGSSVAVIAAVAAAVVVLAGGAVLYARSRNSGSGGTGGGADDAATPPETEPEA